MIELEWLTPASPNQPTARVFAGPVISIGRSPGNDIELDNPSVSGVHGRVLIQPEAAGGQRSVAARYADMHSTNGSRLLRGGATVVVTPGERDAVPLREGDVLALGDPESPVRLKIVRVGLSAAAFPDAPETMEVGDGEGGAFATVIARRAVFDEPGARVAGDASRSRSLLALARELSGAESPGELLQRLAGSILKAVPAVDTVQVEWARAGTDASAPEWDPALTRSRDGLSDGVGARRPIPKTLVRESLARREAVLSNGLQSARPSESIVRAGIESGICAPLLSGGKAVEGVGPTSVTPLGVLLVASRGRQILLEADLEFVALAAQYFVAALLRLRALDALAEANGKLADQNKFLNRQTRETAKPEMLGQTPAMDRLRQRIAQVAPTDSSVVIFGETGSGKELVARAMHDQSHRREGMFVAINCAAIPATLLESQLFGHTKGAFTGAVQNHRGYFALADGGTLLLDEVAEIPLELQSKLLRVLQEREIWPLGAVRAQPVDVRVVAASHRDLRAEVTAGRFREDLYYRLNVITLAVPPLRERADDVVLIAKAHLAKLRARAPEGPTEFSKAAFAAMRGYPWPGNIRELLNEVERSAIFAGAEPVIGLEHLSDAVAACAPEMAGWPEFIDDPAVGPVPSAVLAAPSAPAGETLAESARVAGAGPLVPPTGTVPSVPTPPGMFPVSVGPLKDVMRAYERQVLVAALAANGGNRTHTARALGISRQALLVKLGQFELT